MIGGMCIPAVGFSPQMIRTSLMSFCGLLLAASPAMAETEYGPPRPSPQQWKAYWYQGKAELTSYSLQQARYGEIHEGRSVLVFVTEPFSRSKQVKLDGPGGRDEVSVLKLNHLRKFNTGIYPYSTMRSVFTPVTEEATLKVTTSVQEWCGHVFMQLNRRGDGFEGQAFSYFESEGDRALKVPAGTLLEDAVWNTIRLDPSRLPVGTVSMLPGSTFLRLLHVPVEPRRATAKLTKSGSQWTYTVRYPDLGRTLSIDFEDAFPYRITGWIEESTGVFGGKPLRTVAKLNKSMTSDYWNHHRTPDRALREALGLPRDY